jgi:hypothetical protein
MLGSWFRRIRAPFSNADKRRVFLLKATDSPIISVIFKSSSMMDWNTLEMFQNFCTWKKRLKNCFYYKCCNPSPSNCVLAVTHCSRIVPYWWLNIFFLIDCLHFSTQSPIFVSIPWKTSVPTFCEYPQTLLPTHFRTKLPFRFVVSHLSFYQQLGNMRYTITSTRF